MAYFVSNETMISEEMIYLTLFLMGMVIINDDLIINLIEVIFRIFEDNFAASNFDMEGI